MKYINFLLLCGNLSLLVACERKKCQNPPQTLLFSLNKTTGENVITPVNADKVAVRYFRDGQLATVNDLRIQPPNYSVESLDIIRAGRQTTDTARFYVSVDNKNLGVMQLKTYIDDSPCDGWTRIRELQFNGRVVPYDNMKPGYKLTTVP